MKVASKIICFILIHLKTTVARLESFVEPYALDGESSNEVYMRQKSFYETKVQEESSDRDPAFLFAAAASFLVPEDEVNVEEHQQASVHGDGTAHIGEHEDRCDDSSSSNHSSTTSLHERIVQSEGSFEDDRTLLDVFGEVAKEYLTHKVIPSTDVDCNWDWRTIRCEPACVCRFQFKWGDYHLGRSCRRYSDASMNAFASLETCEVPEQPIVKRLRSLAQDSLFRLQKQFQHAGTNILEKSAERFSRLQVRTCSDVWALQRQWILQQQFSTACLAHARPVRWQERILCGGHLDFEPCEQSELS